MHWNEYVPAGQEVHTDAPGGEYVPGEQVEQAEAPAEVETSPAGHSGQKFCPFNEKEPAGHWLQEDAPAEDH